MITNIAVSFLALRIANAIIGPSGCLSHPENLVGWYDGDSLEIANGRWTDKSGGNNNGIISGNGISLFDGVDEYDELYLNNEKIVHGTIATKVTFPQTVIGESTVFNLCKYKDIGTKGRILQAESFTALWGFQNGRSGQANIDSKWISGTVNSFGTNWVLSTQQPQIYRGNFIDFTATPQTNAKSTRLMINQGFDGTQDSDWACAEFIFVNELLSMNEIECIENYLDIKYGLRPKENPAQCLLNPETLRGWYDGDSFDLNNNVWKDKSGYGYNNNAEITGTGIQIFDGTDDSSEFYLNGQTIIEGSTAVKIRFNPTLQPQHTTFNLCKFQEVGAKARIIQAETYYGAYGFCSANSGVAHEVHWITENIDHFGNQWLLSSQSPQWYRGNFIDFTITPQVITETTKLTINRGLAATHKSDWACAEIIMIDEILTEGETNCIEQYFDTKYGLRATETPTETPTSYPTPSPTFKPCTETTTPMNIEFVIDESGSVNYGAGNENNYAQSIDFVINLIENSINSESKVAAMSFATVNQHLHGFDDPQDSRTDIVNALQAEKSDYAAQWTDTYNALLAAANEFSSNSIPATDKNIVFLVTDGLPSCPNDNSDPDCRTDICADSLVNVLNNAGIDLYIIGVTAGFDRSKLDCLVDETLPDQQKVFLLHDFTQESFKEVEENVRGTVLCPDANDEGETPLARSINKYIESSVNIKNNNKVLIAILVDILACIVTVCILIGTFYGCYRYKFFKTKAVEYEKVGVVEVDGEIDEMQILI